MNPVAVIAHVVAVVAGAWGGFLLVGRVSPDLPDPDTEPGLTATAPEEISGSSDDSLYRETPLLWALEDLADQLAAGDALVQLNVTPGKLETVSREAEEGLFAPDDVVASAPQWIVSQIAERRPEVTLDGVRSMDLVATEDGPQWFVQLVSHDPRVSPPWSYIADAEGDLIRAGGLPPTPILE